MNHNLDNITPARFSDNVDIIDITPPPRRRRRWWLLILALIGAIIAWNVLAAYEAWRLYAGILAVFWFFALGIHPVMAAGNTIRDWFDGDDS